MSDDEIIIAALKRAGFAMWHPPTGPVIKPEWRALYRAGMEAQDARIDRLVAIADLCREDLPADSHKAIAYDAARLDVILMQQNSAKQDDSDASAL